MGHNRPQHHKGSIKGRRPATLRATQSDAEPAIRLEKEACAVEGCARSARSKGWCHRHYLDDYMGRPQLVDTSRNGKGTDAGMGAVELPRLDVSKAACRGLHDQGIDLLDHKVAKQWAHICVGCAAFDQCEETALAIRRATDGKLVGLWAGTYYNARGDRPPCKADGCERLRRKGGYCYTHKEMA